MGGRACNHLLALPVTPTVARELLQAIDGKPAPEEWTGWMAAPYRLGESRAPVRLSARGTTRHATVRNIFALLPGTDPGLPPLHLLALPVTPTLTLPLRGGGRMKALPLRGGGRSSD